MTVFIYILLVMLIVTPIFLIFLNNKVLQKKYDLNHISFASAIIIFVSFIVNMTLVRNQLNTELYAFDFNKDGAFSDEEMVSGFHEAMSAWTAQPEIGSIVFVMIFCAIYYQVLQVILKKST